MKYKSGMEMVHAEHDKALNKLESQVRRLTEKLERVRGLPDKWEAYRKQCKSYNRSMATAYLECTDELEAILRERKQEPLRHDFKWDPCCTPGTGGLMICKRCNASYCCPPWTPKKLANEICDIEWERSK